MGERFVWGELESLDWAEVGVGRHRKELTGRGGHQSYRSLHLVVHDQTWKRWPGALQSKLVGSVAGGGVLYRGLELDMSGRRGHDFVDGAAGARSRGAQRRQNHWQKAEKRKETNNVSRNMFSFQRGKLPIRADSCQGNDVRFC